MAQISLNVWQCVAVRRRFRAKVGVFWQTLVTTSIFQVAAELEANQFAEMDEGDEDAVVDEEEGERRATRYYVPIFNPGSNGSAVSWLRLINSGDQAAEIVIAGTDDEGEPPPHGEVRLVLEAGAARMLSAEQIEQGGDDFDGRFGDGAGKWRLSVSTDAPIQVMSLIQSSSGCLTNLSR